MKFTCLKATVTDVLVAFFMLLSVSLQSGAPVLPSTEMPAGARDDFFLGGGGQKC